MVGSGLLPVPHVVQDDENAESQLRIGSCLACVYRIMDACGKFGEHERSVRVAPEMNCTHHFMEHGRASMKIWFMMAQ